MKNLDAIKNAKAKFAQNLKTAIDSKDEAKMTDALNAYADNIQQSIIEVAQEIGETADNTILAKRGFRQLTSAEQKFYNNFVTAAKSADVKQALTGLDVTIPQTILDTVLEDITNNHPLLDAIGIENTYGSVKAIFATDTKQLAAWGALNSKITQELAGTIQEKDFSTSKVSAFVPVPKDMLDLGATYIDAYVRRILADALAYAFEDGFINGDGNGKPIGMLKDPEGAVKANAYTEKTATKLTSLDVKSYMGVVAKLAKGNGGKTNNITSVDLIVNPVD
jgi:phage capsid family|nr:MAG TPA: major capsid protein [Caudoviricetes sp.]